MALNSVKASATDWNACRLDKPGAQRITVQVGNQTCRYQLNVAPFGTGETWQPAEGANLTPGMWTFDPADWAEYGVERAHGIRFLSVDAADPAVINAS